MSEVGGGGGGRKEKCFSSNNLCIHMHRKCKNTESLRKFKDSPFKL